MARSALFTTSWDDGCRQDGRISAILSQVGVTGTFYATTGEGGRRTADDAIALLRNVGRCRRIPAIPLLLSWSRLPYLHVWGHADDLDQFELWDFLPEVLDVAVAAGATPVTNTEAFTALEGNV